MLKVSDNRRFLVHEDGSPFFYLGDTAWELFHRLTLDEARTLSYRPGRQAFHGDPGRGARRARRAARA